VIGDDVRDVTTLAQLLRLRAVHEPDRVGYTFLDAGAETPVTYGALDRRARAIAAQLRQAGVREGDRALLLYPPGEEFVAGLFGCLYAAVVAVPAFPPDPARLDRTLPRLLATVADATPIAALTVTPLLALAQGLAESAPAFGAMRWIATDTAPVDAAGEWRPPGADADTIALLQYTSGSTGTPKGVVLSNGNLLHNSRLIQQFFATTPDSRGFSWLPPYHDMGLIGGLLQPLYVGLPVWLMSPLEFLRRPVSWLEELSRRNVTMSGGPNFAYDLCVRKTTPEQRAQLDLGAWRVAFNGAEPVRRSTLERFATAFAPAGFRADAFLPCYGLAEATLIVSGGRAASIAGQVDAAALERGAVVPAPTTSGGLVSSGPGAADQRIEIVDPHTHRRCPADRVGEIWVRGPSVAHGYWRRPDESRAAFQATIDGAGDEAFLRTGDLGFIRDGELVVTGRLKDLIIIRGRNHYPQDLEQTAEEAHPALRPGCAAAILVENQGEDRLALVHEVVRGREHVDLAEVARDVRVRIAAQHEVRVELVVLIPAGALPKTSSGKVSRGACRRLLVDGELPELGRDELPVGDPLEVDRPDGPESAEEYLRRRIAAACGIRADRIERDQPLLAAGLDSLAAQELRHEIESDLGIALPLRDVLTGASLAEVAAKIGDQLTGAPNPVSAPASAPVATTHVSRLSPGQRALWFLQQLEPHSAAHVTTAACRLTGRLDGQALRRAVDTVIARHPALRTTFTTDDGEPVQLVHPPGGGAVREVDVSGLDDEALSGRLGDDAALPFDLVAGPLLRVHVYRRALDEHVLLLAVHHLATDFWSTMLLGRELAALYAEQTGGPPAERPAPPATVADLLAAQDGRLDGPRGRELTRYWDEQVGAGLPRLNLGGPGTGSSSSRGASRAFRIDGELAEKLRRCAAAERVTLYVLLLAGYTALLHRLTGQDDIVVGTPLAARTDPAARGTVGYLMNPVPIRSQAGGAVTFRGLLEQTRTRVVGALEHQDLPSALIAERHADARAGLFQTMFVFNRPTATDAAQFPAALLGHAGIRRSFGPLRAESVAVPARESAFDIELSLSEIGGAIHGLVRHRTDVLDGPAAHRLVGQFTAVLDAACTDPGTRLGALLQASGAERDRMLGPWNATDRALDDGRPVPDLVGQQAARRPLAAAVVAGDTYLTYRELERRANQLAHRLLAAGVGARSRVGVCLDRRPAGIVALLAVLKTGAAYVPVDPLNPPERIADAFTDAGIEAILSQANLAAKVPGPFVDVPGGAADGYSADPPGSLVAPGDVAYVIYTSGSTGRPKGVAVPHRALTNYTAHAAHAYEIGPDDRVLQFASIGFDASAEEIFPTLVRGACLVLRNDRMLASPEAFLRACGEQAVTVLNLPTAYWHDVVVALDEGAATVPESVRLVIIGGETARPERVAAWQRLVGDRVRLVNTYGPTEATIVATAHELTGADGDAGVPIGRPVANVRAYVLDDAAQPVPVGVVGELYLGGSGLAYGYLHRPSLTAHRFVADPFGPPGGRLYRTGDLARYRPDGSLAFVARADRQIKINGYRVELGEIESALRDVPGVADAAVVLEPAPGRLLAYVAPGGPSPFTPQTLRDALRARLPEYMVPAQYVRLPALPRGTTGKIDYAALPAADPIPAAEAPPTPEELPQTAEERALAAIWCEVLEVPAVRRDDDFFALGGQSLQATKVVARISDSLGRDLPLRAAFEAPTLAALAHRLQGAPPSRSGPVPRARRDQPLPTSFAQHRIWFLQQLEPDSTSYHVPRALRLYGSVDVDTVTAALADLEARHEILRTTFPEIDGEPVQCIHQPRGIPVTLVDRRGVPASERERWISDHIVEAGREPFDLEAGPLLRVTLIRLADDEYVLVVVEHHLIHDGWAQGVFLRDFLELYEACATNREPRLPDLPIQYADFAVWQRDTVRGERLDALLGYWREQLKGAPPVLRLPTDRPRPRVLAADGGQETLIIDGDLARALRGVGQQHDATLFMTMFAAFITLLYAQSGQDDIVVGAGIANRQRPELENLLGMIINTLPLRIDVSGDPPFVELLRRVRETCLDAYAHQDMPLEKLVEDLRPPRSLSHAPLFQVMFSFLNTPMPALRMPGVVDLEVLDAHNRSAKFDLNAVIIPGAGDEPLAEIVVLLEYNTNLFDATTAARFAGQYRALLEAIAADPRRSLDELIGLRPPVAAGRR
jgi:amino acid adenylation domain-containing protein